MRSYSLLWSPFIPLFLRLGSCHLTFDDGSNSPIYFPIPKFMPRVSKSAFHVATSKVPQIQSCPFYFIAPHLPAFSDPYQEGSKCFNVGHTVASLPRLPMILPVSVDAVLFFHVPECVFFFAWNALPSLSLSNSYSHVLTLFGCHPFYEAFFDVLGLVSPLFCISKARAVPLFPAFFQVAFSGRYA